MRSVLLTGLPAIPDPGAVPPAHTDQRRHAEALWARSRALRERAEAARARRNAALQQMETRGEVQRSRRALLLAGAAREGTAPHPPSAESVPPTRNWQIGCARRCWR